MKSKDQTLTNETTDEVYRKRLEYMSDMLSEFQKMASSMELETLAYLLEVSILEAQLQIEIDDYS